MLTLGEYAASVLIGFGLTAVVLVACGAGYLLKVTASVVIRAWQARTPLKHTSIKFGTRNLIGVERQPSIAADCSL